MMHFCFTRLLLTAIAPAIATVTVLATEVQPKDSPFLPRGGNAITPAGTTNEGYQLTGYVALEKGGMLSITRVSDKRSFWVPLGGTVNEITALGYDSSLDQGTIRVEGRLLTVSLKKSVIAPGANVTPTVASVTSPQSPSPVLATATPPVAATPPNEPKPPAPGTQAFQESEARMLVTDLLEIGLQQRKAYEEAQRQAATQGPRAPRADAATTGR